MTMQTRERPLRRAASRQGLALAKSRSRTPEDPDCGTYCLYDPNARFLIAGSHNTGFGLGLDEIEKALGE